MIIYIFYASIKDSITVISGKENSEISLFVDFSSMIHFTARLHYVQYSFSLRPCEFFCWLFCYYFLLVSILNAFVVISLMLSTEVITLNLVHLTILQLMALVTTLNASFLLLTPVLAVSVHQTCLAQKRYFLVLIHLCAHILTRPVSKARQIFSKVQY